MYCSRYRRLATEGRCATGFATVVRVCSSVCWVCWWCFRGDAVVVSCHVGLGLVEGGRHVGDGGDVFLGRSPPLHCMLAGIDSSQVWCFYVCDVGVRVEAVLRTYLR